MGDGGVGDGVGRELAAGLLALAVRPSVSVHATRVKTDPLIQLPLDRGGGRAYMRTIVDQFNSGVDTALSASRLGRIRLSSVVIAEIAAVQEARKAKVQAQVDSGGEACDAGAAREDGTGAGSPPPPDHRHQVHLCRHHLQPDTEVA